MADYSPTASRASVSKIPMCSASTRKHANYDRIERRYDLKYRGRSTPDTSSTTSTQSLTLTPSTFDNASPEVPAKIPDAPATSTSKSKLAKFPRRALTTSALTPSLVVRVLEQLEDGEDMYTPPDPLLHQTQALLHAELEILMQALHLRFHTGPHLSAPYVQAFEDLAADTLYSGMSSQILAAIDYQRAGKSEETKHFADTLESHLLREAAKNTRRYNRGIHFFDQHDTESTVTEVRRQHIEGDARLTSSSLTGESEWLAELETEYVHGLAALNKCTCDVCASDMEQLVGEYWVAAQGGYAAFQEAEVRMRGQDWLGHGLARENANCGIGLAVAQLGVVFDCTSDWVSTDSKQDEQDEQDAQGEDVEQGGIEYGSRWVARVHRASLDQEGDILGPQKQPWVMRVVLGSSSVGPFSRFIHGFASVTGMIWNTCMFEIIGFVHGMIRCSRIPYTKALLSSRCILDLRPQNQNSVQRRCL